MTYSNLALGASNLLLGTSVGAGLNQSLFVMPGWFSSPPQSLQSAQANRAYQGFWIPLQVGCALALAGAVALNRKGRRRRLLSSALGLYLGTWISTAAYFAPEIIRLGKVDSRIPAGEIARRGKRWLGLTWLRHAALGAAWALNAAALGQRP
jgi:hypothetical protein